MHAEALFQQWVSFCVTVQSAGFFALQFHLSLVYSSAENVVQELGRYLFYPTCSVIRWYINASYSTSNLLATDLLFGSKSP